MKRIISFLILTAVMAWTGCNKVDLSPLEKRIADLEKTVNSLNEISLTGDYITDIQPLSEGGEVVGYVVTFNEHGQYTVRNGKNGKDGKDGIGEQGLPGADGAWMELAPVSVRTEKYMRELDFGETISTVRMRLSFPAKAGALCVSSCENCIILDPGHPPSWCICFISSIFFSSCALFTAASS